MTTYYTYDNGSRPYKVVISNNIVNVYEYVSQQNDRDIYKTDQSFRFTTKQIFIGRSPKNRMTTFSGGYGKQFDGNSILLHIKNLDYVFIGDTVTKFKAHAKIVKYVSPVGNNLVPYPYAVDLLGNYYLIIENVMMHRLPDNKKFGDPYQYYYTNCLITADMGRIPPKKPTVKNFMDISSFYIGNDRYTMTYKTNPREEFIRLSANGDLRIITTNRTQIILSKNSYVGIMKSFGKLKGFSPMNAKKMEAKPLEPK
jgi:hypothetical protein